MVHLSNGKPESQGGYPPSGGINPPNRKERRGKSMITYADLIQTGIFIVALVGLCYTIFKGKK